MSDNFTADVITPEARRRQMQADRDLDKLIAKGRSLRDSHLGADMNVDAVKHGVTVNWLAQVFNMHAGVVKQRLADCPPLHRRSNGFVYDLKLATRYLVKPVVDVDAYIKTMKIEELPNKLQTEYWSAKQKRLDFERDAGHLWATDDFMVLVGKLFQLVRTRSRLWVDTMEKKTALTTEQRDFFSKQIDELLAAMIEDMKEVATTGATMSVLVKFLAEERQEEAREQAMAAQTADADDDDFDPLSLI